MTAPTPETDRRFWSLSAEAKLIAALRDVGQPEVERLAEIVAEMNQILADLPSERLRRFRDRMHSGPERAVDFPVRMPRIPPEMPPATEWVERPGRFRRGLEHTHWAGPR